MRLNMCLFFIKKDVYELNFKKKSILKIIIHKKNYITFHLKKKITKLNRTLSTTQRCSVCSRSKSLNKRIPAYTNNMFIS